MYPVAAARSKGVVGPAGVPSVFDDAMGVWYADTYQSSPRPQILNAASATAASSNLFTASRRMFKSSNFDMYWGASGATITDDAATGPDGVTEASTVVGTGGWVLHPLFTGTLPAGTYTVACNVKRNTGSDQQFAFSFTNTATRSSAKTATSSWQRFSYTWTYAAETRDITFISICSVDGSTDANLQICDLELYSGSSDLGPTTLAGHLLLGATSCDTRPSYASGAIDLSSSGFGAIQFPTTTTISSTGITAIALVSKVASGSGFDAFMSKAQNYQHFTGATSLSDQPCDFTLSSHNAAAGLWDLQNLGGYHGITQRYDGTNRDLFIDDVRLFRKASSVSDFSIRDFHCGLVASKDLPCGLKIHAMALWNRALSDSEVRQVVATMQARAALSSLTATSVARVLVADGDSVTALNSPASYAYKYGSHDSPQVIGAVVAVSGSSLADVQAREAVVDAIIPPDITGRKFIYSCLLGANDLSPGIDEVAWAASLSTHFAGRKAAGYTKTVGITVLPSTDGQINTQRVAANTAIRAFEGVSTDDTVDFATDATMGPDAAASDTGLYSDGKHPTDTGMTNLETVYRPVINGL